MKLIKHPHSALSSTTELIKNFDVSLVDLVEQMTDVMYTNNGVGLAAPQVDVLSKVIIIDPSSGDRKHDFMAMVNPKFLPTLWATTETLEEGCLSLPGVKIKVSRWSDIDVEYYDVSGVFVKKQLSGFVARIVQHEIDHLNGKTLLDKGNIK